MYAFIPWTLISRVLALFYSLLRHWLLYRASPVCFSMSRIVAWISLWSIYVWRKWSKFAVGKIRLIVRMSSHCFDVRFCSIWCKILLLRLGSAVAMMFSVAVASTATAAGPFLHKQRKNAAPSKSLGTRQHVTPKRSNGGSAKDVNPMINLSATRTPIKANKMRTCLWSFWPNALRGMRTAAIAILNRRQHDGQNKV